MKRTEFLISLVKRQRWVWVCLAMGLVLSELALAKELLRGEVIVSPGESAVFSLSGENREEVIGGLIKIGEREFEITKVSRLGLIGASRLANSAGEFLVFSSSYSGQTAVGQPWVAADEYVNCEKDYNSFVGIYRIEDAAQLKSLGEVPYPKLTEGEAKAATSQVLCFMSRPPA